MLLNIPEAPIVVLGEAMLDIFVSGDVDRISPEAPVPVLRHRRDRLVAGGAGNVACNVAHLGGAPILITLVGDDSEGRSLMALLGAEGVTTEAIVTPRRMTTSKTRLMGGSHHLMRIDREDSSPISEELEDEVLARIKSVLPRARALAISDYGKGMLTDRVLVGAIAMARARGVPIIVDPKRRDFSLYAGADVIKPNRAELAAASGLICATDEEVFRAAEEVMRQTGAALLVTRAEKGMSYFSSGSLPIHMPTQAKLVFDVSGAGDAVMATFAYGLVGDLPIEQTMRLANLAAGIVVSKPGTATITLDELRAEAALQEESAAFRRGGLASVDEARAIREHWRRQGLSVGFTNGCFDLLHPGHVAILRGAARLCDRLVVGLNADESVTRLKGPTRPVQRATSRAAVLGAIDCVALVVIFDEDTPYNLIGALMPDVLIKGADYSEDQIVGADVVRSAGGRVERIKLVEGQSTSELIRRANVRPVILEDRARTLAAAHHEATH
jgi:D-beta-D-heptose 7-phosphate kinase / D-beta-D-heptose 1-phosphate adenosyltransferase